MTNLALDIAIMSALLISSSSQYLVHACLPSFDDFLYLRVRRRKYVGTKNAIKSSLTVHKLQIS